MSVRVHVHCENVHCNHEFTASVPSNWNREAYRRHTPCPNCGKYTLEITGTAE